MRRFVLYAIVAWHSLRSLSILSNWTCSVRSSLAKAGALFSDSMALVRKRATVFESTVPCRFAGCPIPAGRLVLKFEGPIYDKDTCPDFSEAIQVGMNAWMWSSGGLDDLVNHR